MKHSPLVSLLLATLLLLHPAPTHATPADSLPAGTTSTLRPTQFILPAALITAGAIGINSHRHTHSPDYQINKTISRWRGNHPFRADEYLRFVPLAMDLGLNLLTARSREEHIDHLILTANTYAVMGILVKSLKLVVDERRPDGSDDHSFPSGHTATAFAGAELVRRAYRHVSPWYGAGAYTAAVLTGFLRIYNGHHWLSDVLAGAGIGILSTQIAYLLFPVEQKLLFPRRKAQAPACLLLPYYDANTRGGGLTASITF